MIIPGLDIRTAIEEKLHRRDLATPGSLHEGGVSIIIPGLDIRAAIEEVFNQRRIALPCCFNQSIINSGS